MSTAAVLTADVVNSTSLLREQQQKLLRSLKQLFADRRLEFYRGDSFQAFLKNPSEAYAIILQTRVMARSILPGGDIRIGLGLGEARVTKSALSTNTSEAFVLSGRALDTLKDSWKKLNIASNDPVANVGFEIICNFTDFLFERMTPAQAEVIHHLLLAKTQTEIAKKLKKSQPTIARHAKAGGWLELETMMEQFKKLLANITT